MKITNRFRSLFAFAVCALVASVLMGCASPPGTPAKTPAQIAAQVCPATTTALSELSVLSLDPKVMVDLAVASKAANLVCGASAAITTTNLQALANSALPTIITAIKGSPLPVAKQNQLILDVTAANVILNAAISSLQT